MFFRILSLTFLNLFLLGCSGATTGTIGLTKPIAITCEESIVNVTEGEVKSVKVNLASSLDRPLILRWLLAPSQQGIIHKNDKLATKQAKMGFSVTANFF